MGISLPTESAMVLKGLCSISALPSGTMGKNPPANAGDASDIGSIPGSGRSPGVGNANPLQCSCLKNSMDRGAWRATVREVTEESGTTEMRLNTEHNVNKTSLNDNSQYPVLSQ